MIRVTDWDRRELGAHLDDILEVYAEAMEVPLRSARSRRGVMRTHLDRPGLRAVAALEHDRLVGIGYGYVGSPGQWWHDQVREALTDEQARTWLDGAFEVCELHVRPALHGTGLGRQVLGQLLAGVGTTAAILTTPDHETRARRFYRQGGWTDLAVGLTFPGDPRSFAVLGLQLRNGR